MDSKDEGTRREQRWPLCRMLGSYCAWLLPSKTLGPFLGGSDEIHDQLVSRLGSWRSFIQKTLHMATPAARSYPQAIDTLLRECARGRHAHNMYVRHADAVRVLHARVHILHMVLAPHMCVHVLHRTCMSYMCLSYVYICKIGLQ